MGFMQTDSVPLWGFGLEETHLLLVSAPPHGFTHGFLRIAVWSKEPSLVAETCLDFVELGRLLRGRSASVASGSLRFRICGDEFSITHVGTGSIGTLYGELGTLRSRVMESMRRP
jgi:hypothetical protein